MPRSNAPQALSVVSLTVPGDVEATANNIMYFDDRTFGFNHGQTWAGFPAALQGVFEAEQVIGSFAATPKRIQDCLVALCRLGKNHPRNTMKFADYPAAGLNEAQWIDWDPEIRVKVKASCWYVTEGRIILPLLQPRKAALSRERMAVYGRLARQAYCKDEWLDAEVEIVDLSGDTGQVEATVIEASDLPEVNDRMINDYVRTFVEAKKQADLARKEKPKKIVVLPMGELLGLD
jgi:hypothetical protein